MALSDASDLRRTIQFRPVSDDSLRLLKVNQRLRKNRRQGTAVAYARHKWAPVH